MYLAFLSLFAEIKTGAKWLYGIEIELGYKSYPEFVFSFLLKERKIQEELLHLIQATTQQIIA